MTNVWVVEFKDEDGNDHIFLYKNRPTLDSIAFQIETVPYKPGYVPNNFHVYTCEVIDNDY